MREPPPHVSDAQVLAAVQAHWDGAVTAVEHLPVGFGAHHWRADGVDGARLFVTFDGLGPRHSLAQLDATYRAAAELAAAGLGFVLPPCPTAAGSMTVSLANGALSVTAWCEGSSGNGPLRDRSEAEETAALLRRLHATTPPATVRDWEPVVGPRFAAELALSLGSPWLTGPYGERARESIAVRVGDVGRWSARYQALVAQSASRTWAATHGEPHSANQLVTETGRLFLDWESLRRAPAERDLRTLVENGYADLCAPDWDMVELFDLEWRLDEIAQYAAWFSTPHTGTRSDEVAYGGLLGELERVEFARPT